MTMILRQLGAATAVAAIVLGTGAAGAWAQEKPVEVYRARLSEKDHYNMYGERLTTVAAILRQDRAYFHLYDMRDREDGDDVFFDSPANRDRLERMLVTGHVSQAVSRAITRDHPLVEVTVYPSRVDVTLAD